MEGRAGEITPVPVLLDMGFIEFFFLILFSLILSISRVIYISNVLEIFGSI